MTVGSVRNPGALAITIAFAVVIDAVLVAAFVWCVPVLVASSQEKSALLTEIARDYSASARVAGRCVKVTVSRIASGEAEDVLARDWDPSADGDPPTVWAPAASTWLTLLREHRAARHAEDILPAATPPSLMRSPLVVAMPEPMAKALGWPARQIGWSELLALARDPGGWTALGHPEWGAFKLGKTNPTISTSGLHALIGSYYAAVGRPPVDADLTDPKVRDFVQGVESSVVHYGDSVSTFLKNLLKADRRHEELTYVSAIAMEEKQVRDYNDGNPESGPVPTETPPRTRLFAFYPKEGTLFADHPYAVLTAPWVDALEREAAEAFLTHLISPAVQARFTAAAFRDHAGLPGPSISRENGLLPGEPRVILQPPVASLLTRMQDSWDGLRKRVHVLIAIDTSSAMGDAVAGGGTKLDLAKRAAKAALEDLAGDDDVGIWTFAAGVSANAPYRELAPIAPRAARRETLASLIDGLSSSGDPTLFATTRAAVRHVTSVFDTRRIDAVILLTSGRNAGSDADIVDLQRELENQRDERWVRVFGVTYGSPADAVAVGKIGEASLGNDYRALDARTIGRVISAILSNF